MTAARSGEYIAAHEKSRKIGRSLRGDEGRRPGEKTHLMAQRLVAIVDYGTKTLGIRHCMVLWMRKRGVSKVWQVAMVMSGRLTGPRETATHRLPCLSSRLIRFPIWSLALDRVKRNAHRDPMF